ncbi:MAG: hypothetical protein FVQ83_12230 [Chloroflexi bacterium]|nr:hypothetical protein [Chloroflexota bacterium]
MQNTTQKLQRYTLIAIIILALGLAGLACDTLVGGNDGETTEESDVQSSADGDAETTEESDEQETLTCELICNIDDEQYGFEISCESGQVTSTMNNTTRFAYDSDGSVASITVEIDQELEYESSGNIYLIEGTIIIDQSSNTISEDITATGGAFGESPQTCDS